MAQIQGQRLSTQGAISPKIFLNPASFINMKRAPLSSDHAEQSTIWVYSQTPAGVAVNQVYINAGKINGADQWLLIESSGGIGNFSQLTVNPGPTNLTGVLTQVGTANINTTGTANTNINSSTNTGTVTIGSANATAVALLAPLMGVDSTAGGAIGIGASVTTGTINIGHALTTGAMVIGDALTTGSIVMGAAGVGAATSSVTVKGDSLLLDSKPAGDIKVGHSITTGTIEVGDALTTGSMVIGHTGSTSTVTVKADSLLLDSAAAGDIKLGHSVTTGTVEIADALTTGTLTIGNHASTNTVNIKSGSGGTNVVSGGFFAVDFAQATVASPTATAVINARQCYANFTGFTTASGSSQVFIITNSIITAGSSILVTSINLGSNDAQMTVQRVLPGAGTVSITLKNNGAAALNGDVNITMWVMD